MELYQRAREDLFEGGTLLYVHGFASSGASGTVRTLRTLLPKTRITAPDLPVEPSKAMDLLRDICQKESPSVIVGTSMGGMYAEMLHGYDRVLVNPAFCLADTILRNNGLGRREFRNPRSDGQTSFLVTKGLLEEFRQCASRCFEKAPASPVPGKADEGDGAVYGLFGKRDTLVDTYDLFASHYGAAIRFDGEHFLNDSAVVHSLMPVLQWISDSKSGKAKKSIAVEFDALQRDSSAVKGFIALSKDYDTTIIHHPDPRDPSSYSAACRWADEVIGVPAWNRVMETPMVDCLLSDYLLTRDTENYGAEGFMGTVLEVGKEPLRSWEEIMDFFEKLGGQ